MIEFIHPERLIWLATVPLCLLLLVYGYWQRRRTLRAIAGSAILSQAVTQRRRRVAARHICTIGAVALIVLAIAQPHWGSQTRSLKREGRDFLILLDVSQSMYARDASPSRLQAALSAIRRFVATVSRDGGHRLGLLIFAGRASPLVPLTADYDLFLSRLDEVGQATLRGGSRIGDALRQALYGFGTLAPSYTDLIVLSDGEDHGSAPGEIARTAGRLGTTIYSIGIGDSRNGARIPVDLQNTDEFVRIDQTEVISRMNPSPLIEIARLANGEYVSGSAQTDFLSDLYNRRLVHEPRRQLDSASGEQPIQRYQWFVVFACALLLLEQILASPRAATRKHQPGSRLASTLPAIVIALCLMVASQPLRAQTADLNMLVTKGNEFYQLGDFHAAAAHYSKAMQQAPDSAIVQFNYATARFKLYDYGGAIEHYTLALQLADGPLRASIEYNLGVVKHQQAIGNLMTFQDASTPLQTASDYYRDSLEKTPSFADARYNLELAHRLAQEIRRQRVSPQANAKAREQKTSDNKGQAGDEQGDKAAADAPDTRAEQNKNDAQNQSGSQTSQQNGIAEQASSSQAQQPMPQNMNAIQAERELELARGRVEQQAEQRLQNRRARMMADPVSKFW